MINDFLNRCAGDRALRAGVFTVLVLLSVFLAITSLDALRGMGRSGVPATETITVTGEGKATIAPDVARVSFTVQNSAASVSDAQAKTTEQANNAIAYLAEQGIAEKDIKTLAYTISPQYAYANCAPGMYCPGTPRVTGYEVAQTIQLTVRELERVGDLLAGLGQREVQNISGPNFALDDATAGYAAARADAIEKARVEAKQLAKQLGVRLGEVVSFNESSGYPYPMYGMGGDMRSAAMEAKATPEVPAGENTYQATVSITYEIR